MTQANIDFGTAYYQVTDTTDQAAEAKIHSAVIKHMSANGMVPNFRLFPAWNSMAVGVEASELVTNSQRPDRLILGVNFAPPDKDDGTKDNIRNDFFCADLGDNVFMCGTSNGFEFSYVKPRIREMYRLVNTNHLLSQFRSLEVLPKHAVLFAVPEERERLKAQGYLARIEDIDTIVPPVPDITHVLEVDNFGNVKLVPSEKDRAMLSSLAEGNKPVYFAFGKAALEVGGGVPDHGRFYEGVAAETFFAAPLGTNVVAARSSSTLVDGRNVPVIATIRARPGETKAAFDDEMPVVGTPVVLVDKRPPISKRHVKTRTVAL